MTPRATSLSRILFRLGVGPEPGEDVGEVQAGAFGQQAYGLFDDDPSVEGGLQLLGEDFAAAQRALGQDPHGRDVARAWPTRRSPGGSGPSWVLNRFSAPIVTERSRIGSAWTARKPSCTAGGANCGHRSRAAGR